MRQSRFQTDCSLNLTTLSLATLLVFGALTCGCGLRQSAQAAPSGEGAQHKNWKPREFPISYWAGPPEPFVTLERFREIKNAGITFVTPVSDEWPSLETNRKILTYCQQLGMKAFISDRRLPLEMTGKPGASAALDAVINDYKGYPALAGYTLRDEPPVSLFAGLGEVAAYLRRKDPTHDVYINLYPNYATPEQMGAPDYEAYVRAFNARVQPFVLSYDHYNLTTGGDGSDFFPNLAAMRHLSQEFGIPFWQIVQVVQFGGHRHLTEAELRYEAMQTLAYGAKGLLWFTYWQPAPAEYQHSLILKDGSRDPHYDMVRRVNREVQALGGQLLEAKSLSVFHTGQIPEGATARQAGTAVDVTGAGNLTVGLFRGKNSELFSLVTNADYKEAVKTEVMIFSGDRVPQYLDLASGRWLPATTQARPGGFNVSLDLAAGGAALLKW